MDASWESLRNTFAHFHPALVHFPIGLLLSGAALEAWHATRHRHVTSEISRALLAMGFLGVLLSVGSGMALFNPDEFRGRTLDVARMHRVLGLAGGLTSMTAFLLGAIREPQSPSRVWSYRTAYWLTAVLVGLAGHYGGWIVFGWGHAWTP